MKAYLIKLLGVLLLMLAISPICSSCSNDDDTSDSQENIATEFVPGKETLNYMVNGIDVKYNGGEISLYFSCNKSWKANSSDAWCSLSAWGGKSGQNRLQIIIAPNVTVENRDAIVTISFKDKDYYFIVRQDAAKSVTLTNEQPGKLKDLLEGDYLGIERLTLSGSLNGIDIALIRDMGLYGELAVLDLSEASIVAGGAYYNMFTEDSVKTKDNEITDYMFMCFNKLTHLILPKNIIRIGKNAIWNSPKLYSIVLPNTLGSIDDMGISYLPLTSLELPEGLESFGSFALCGLEGLTSITLPSTLKIVGMFPFAETRLKQIHMRSLIPPACPMISDYNEVLNSAILYVPQGCLQQYRTDSEWGKFRTIIEE